MMRVGIEVRVRGARKGEAGTVREMEVTMMMKEVGDRGREAGAEGSLAGEGRLIRGDHQVGGDGIVMIEIVEREDILRKGEKCIDMTVVFVSLDMTEEGEEDQSPQTSTNDQVVVDPDKKTTKIKKEEYQNISITLQTKIKKKKSNQN